MHNFPSRHEQHEGVCSFTLTVLLRAKRYQRPIACCYENYLPYFLCGFLGGNENFADIRAGSLSHLAASPLDFASALCSNLQKD